MARLVGQPAPVQPRRAATRFPQWTCARRCTKTVELTEPPHAAAAGSRVGARVRTLDARTSTPTASTSARCS